MSYYDLPLNELKTYQPAREEPNDFNSFWENTLIESREHPLKPIFKKVDYGLMLIESYDVTFNGYAGQPIKGWLMLPVERDEKIPCVVEYVGYGGGRSYPTEWLLYATAGYAHFVMDTRGQGSGSLSGDTPDLDLIAGSPQYPGFMTRGVLNPFTYYYRRLITDAVRAVEVVSQFSEIAPARIAVTGKSQGGGLSLAVAGLEPAVKLCLPDVPFLCYFRRATRIIDTAPYYEIVRFCRSHRDKVDQVFRTLSYFDGINFAARAKARALFSVGLRDDVCPPSTVFAAYNHYAGEKEIRVYEFNEHDGGGAHQNIERLDFLRKNL